jgi:acyl-CoA-binding protein
MGLEQDFTSAQERVKGLSQRPTNEQLLALYSLFKQGTAGDVSGKRPGMFDLKGRAKYDAWAGRKGLSKDDAMTKYVALVDELVGA